MTAQFVTIMLFVMFITFMVVVFLFWYFYHKAKLKEHLMLLEKGARIEDLVNKDKGSSFPWLKAGIVVIGVGVAFGIINVFDRLGLIDGDVLPFSVLFICGGISFIIANRVDKGTR